VKPCLKKKKKKKKEKKKRARHQWLMPRILASHKAEIRRIVFEASLGK
jgi:hypothetical protein